LLRKRLPGYVNFSPEGLRSKETQNLEGSCRENEGGTGELFSGRNPRSLGPTEASSKIGKGPGDRNGGGGKEKTSADPETPGASVCVAAKDL